MRGIRLSHVKIVASGTGTMEFTIDAMGVSPRDYKPFVDATLYQGKEFLVELVENSKSIPIKDIELQTV